MYLQHCIHALMHACDATYYKENHKDVQIIKIFIRSPILLVILYQTINGGAGNGPCINFILKLFSHQHKNTYLCFALLHAGQSVEGNSPF